MRLIGAGSLVYLLVAALGPSAAASGRANEPRHNDDGRKIFR